jgi:cell division protein FtsL
MEKSLRKFKETLELRAVLTRRIRSHPYFPMFAIGAILLMIACLHVWQRVYVITLVDEVAELRTEQRDLVDQLRKVRADNAALSMASRIQAYAADSLGLRQISADRLYTLVRDDEAELKDTELAMMFSSLRRVAEFFPVVAETEARSAELRHIEPDDLDLSVDR